MESGSSGDPLPTDLFVFISDASAEAERLTLALRAHGYVVVDVPLNLLVGRVTVQRPALVLCDADAEGAKSTLERLHELSPETPVPVVLLGKSGAALEWVEPRLVRATFARPVDVRDVAIAIERIVGPAPRRSSSPAGPASSRGHTSVSSRPPTRVPSVVPSRPSIRPDTAAIPLPPDLAGDPAPREPADAPTIELSGEIQATLAEAEKRLDASRPSPAPVAEEPGPEADVEAALPPDVLLVLGEPLDEEEAAADAEVVTGAGGDGTARRARTTARGFTQAGTGTGAGAGTGTGTGAGTGDGTAVPPSEPSLATSGGRTGATGADRSEEAASPDGERRARQEASTPKPPRPSPEDLLPSAPPPEPEKRPSIGPTTSIDHPVSQPESSLRDPAARAPVPVVESLAPEPPRRDHTSTTPPLRQRPADGAGGPPHDEGTVMISRGVAPPEASATPKAAPKEPPKDTPFAVPTVIRAGDAILVLAQAIRVRFTGSVAFEVDEGIRRIVFRDGDFVTAASGVHGESLVAFLAARGDLPQDAARQAHKLPAFGRRAGAALIAQGHLAQDQLWPVLRAHAEWLVGRVCRIERGGAGLEPTLIDRLQDEPAVFGGATGAEVLVEVVRRVVSSDEAVARLGGPDAVLADGTSRSLLGECALSAADSERVLAAGGRTVRETLDGAPDPSFAAVVYALLSLGVLATRGTREAPRAAPPVDRDPLDDEALRARILARKALVDDGDYFAVLGVARDATGYDIRRAYTSLRKDLEPSRALTARTADLAGVVDEIIEVLDEAYEVLGDQRRRDRYLRAIQAVP